MATSTTQAGGPAPPCYVFRLIKFDAYGNKVQKRKYGFTAKNNEVTQLDKSVYEGIITRAEQTFNLRSKSSYSLYLVLGGGPYVHELGEPDLRLEDYPELSSHSWTQMRSYEQFHEKRNLMHALTPDAKNRKVINLCLIESTLHDLSLRKQFLKDLAQAKLASKTAKLNVESRMRESSASTTSAAAPTATSPTTPATIQIENGVSEPTSTGNTSSPPTPPKPASPTTSVPEDENRGETNGGRSSSPPRRESPYSEVQDFITSFANLIAPPPPPAGNGTAAAANHLPNMNLSAAEFIKRAANFVAPPPPPPPPLSASAAANLAQDAARTAATDPWAAAMAVQSAVRGLPYEPFTRMKTRNPSLALRAPAATSTTTPQPQPQRPAAATSASPASTAPTAKPASPAPSTRSASDDKYASLKAVFDKFVTDFNADLADAFGGAPPSSDGDTDTRASTPTGSPAATLREKDVLEAKGEKENAPKVPSKKAAAPVAHRATCDVCNKWIYGTRYKCFTCPDWDCCDSCLASIDQHHPGHALAAIHTPKDLIRRRPVSNEGHQATHFAIHCDSCNVPITGIRYKCAHPSCPDFDLCSNCEADPASYANNRKIGDHSYKDHLMVKIRQPVSRFGLNTMGSGRWNLDKAIRSIQSAFLGATSLDETEARQSAPAPGLVGELKHGPGKDESTWTVDVPMPFAMYNGGDKEVHLSFDVGTNENGETVILGLSDTKTSPQQPAETSKAKAQKETETHTLVPCAYVSPPAYRAPLGCQMPKLPEKATTVTEEISEELATKVDLDARWINDLTFADGTTVAPGTIFNKVWSVENNGRSAWPEGTRLVCVSGFGKDAVSQSWQQDVAYKVESVSANTKTRITAENIVAPEVAGKFMSYYRFITPDGLRFGDRLWIDIIVEENEGSKSATSSLNSSSIVTPTLKVKGSEDNASVQGHPESVVTALSSAVTSPCTTESELVDMESLSALSHASDEEDDCDFVLLSDEDDFAEVESVAASSSRK